jgi:hypothetical protein
MASFGRPSANVKSVWRGSEEPHDLLAELLLRSGIEASFVKHPADSGLS